MEHGDLTHRFTFHPATDQETQDRHEEVRTRALDLAHSINGLCHDGREKSLAITKLEEAMFWANASIARE